MLRTVEARITGPGEVEVLTSRKQWRIVFALIVVSNATGTARQPKLQILDGASRRIVAIPMPVVDHGVSAVLAGFSGAEYSRPANLSEPEAAGFPLTAQYLRATDRLTVNADELTGTLVVTIDEK